MGVIWVVDQPESNLPEYLLALMGNFPCRVIGSVQSINKLVKISSFAKPNLLFVNMLSCENSPRYVRELIACDLPAIPVVLLFDDSDAIENHLNWNIGASAGEIVARVRKLLLASIAYQQSKIFLDNVVFDTENLTIEDRSLNFKDFLTPKEAKILRLFINKRGNCVSREAIKQNVWSGAAVSDRTIDSHISRLRKRLIEANIAIESIYGGGYILK
jgi:two-component system response regulator BaeR